MYTVHRCGERERIQTKGKTDKQRCRMASQSFVKESLYKERVSEGEGERERA